MRAPCGWYMNIINAARHHNVFPLQKKEKKNLTPTRTRKIHHLLRSSGVLTHGLWPCVVTAGGWQPQDLCPPDIWYFDSIQVYNKWRCNSSNHHHRIGRIGKGELHGLIHHFPSINVKTNVGKMFLQMIKECCPPTHKLYKICNRNTLKISYRTMPNMKRQISKSNRKKLQERREGLHPELKNLPRAYIKVGRHPPPTTKTTTTHHPEVSLHLPNGLMMARWGWWRKGEVCRVTMGHFRVTVGHPRVNMGHLRVTLGHLRVTMGHLRLTIGYLKATVAHIR